MEAKILYEYDEVNRLTREIPAGLGRFHPGHRYLQLRSLQRKSLSSEASEGKKLREWIYPAYDHAGNIIGRTTNLCDPNGNLTGSFNVAANSGDRDYAVLTGVIVYHNPLKGIYDLSYFPGHPYPEIGHHVQYALGQGVKREGKGRSNHHKRTQFEWFSYSCGKNVLSRHLLLLAVVCNGGVFLF